MKKYLLLRDNQESGPQSFEEISASGLRPMDLVWIEGISTSWQYATETAELAPFVKAETKRSVAERRSLPATHPHDPGSKQQEFEADYSSYLADETGEAGLKPLEQLKEREEEMERGPVWRRKWSLPVSNAVNLAAVFTSLVIGAFLIKKAVDNSAAGSEESTASAILFEQPVADKNMHTALATEIVPATVQKTVPKPRPKDIKKQVALQASAYKTGLLGGISGLELTVFNHSPHFVDKVTLAVKYFKKNGDVIETEFFDVTSLKPRSSRVLQVPDKNRGMKVEYSIITVASQQYRAALKQV